MAVNLPLDRFNPASQFVALAPKCCRFVCRCCEDRRHLRSQCGNDFSSVAVGVYDGKEAITEPFRVKTLANNLESRLFLTNDEYGFSVALGTAINGPIVIGCNADANGDIASAGSAYGFLGPGNACASDLDGDFSIGTADLSLLLTSWGLTGEDASGVDINLDGIVDAFDLSEMLHGWGTCGE